MEAILKSYAEKIPEFSVFALLAYWGLAHLKAMTAAFLSHMKGRDEFIKELHDQHMTARAESRDALRENANATRENSVALQELRDVIKSCPAKLNM